MLACRFHLLLALVAPLVFSAHARAAGERPEARARAGQAWFGISMERAGEVGGVRVRHVLRGSPAEAAGLKDGDIVLSLDGEKVRAPEDVSHLIAGHSPGDSVVAAVSRPAGTVSLRVSLVVRPAPDELLRMDRLGAFAPTWIGVEPVGGAPSSLSALRGKVVLLDFWATWCAPCRALVPRLSALQARYGAQGLQVVGVTTGPPEAAAVFAERASMRYPVAIDRSGETSRAYEVSALPTLFVIDKRGVVRDIAVGYDEDREARVEALLRQLLAEPAPSE